MCSCWLREACSSWCFLCDIFLLLCTGVAALLVAAAFGAVAVGASAGALALPFGAWAKDAPATRARAMNRGCIFMLCFLSTGWRDGPISTQRQPAGASDVLHARCRSNAAQP